MDRLKARVSRASRDSASRIRWREWAVGSYSAQLTCPVFIGRTAERDTLSNLLEHAQWTGWVALICGEAGVGKSRLVTEVKTSAASRGYALLQGNCFQADVAFPYAPFLDLFRSRFADIILLAKGQEELPFAQELARFLPDVAVLLPNSQTPPPTSSLDPAQAQRRLFSLLLRFFTDSPCGSHCSSSWKTCIGVTRPASTCSPTW